MANILCCPVCLDEYNENNHLPRNLPCGHMACTDCISVILASSTPRCPECRSNIVSESVTELPVSYTVLHLAQNNLNHSLFTNSHARLSSGINNSIHVIEMQKKIQDKIVELESIVSGKMSELSFSIEKIINEVNIYKKQIVDLQQWSNSLKITENNINNQEQDSLSNSTESNNQEISQNEENENDNEVDGFQNICNDLNILVS